MYEQISFPAHSYWLAIFLSLLCVWTNAVPTSKEVISERKFQQWTLKHLPASMERSFARQHGIPYFSPLHWSVERLWTQGSERAFFVMASSTTADFIAFTTLFPSMRWKKLLLIKRNCTTTDLMLCRYFGRFWVPSLSFMQANWRFFLTACVSFPSAGTYSAVSFISVWSRDNES